MTAAQRHGHAIVIGASLAGLLAARVLADHFAAVTLVERDSLPDGFAPRRGVPQGRHTHGLLARGQATVEALFPGLVDDLVAGGAVPGDIAADGRWYQTGGYRPRFASGLAGLAMTRPYLEGQIRRRVHALPNVACQANCAVRALVAIDDHARVSGVTLERHAAGAPTVMHAGVTAGVTAETLFADLVVDAGGRGSRAPAWLEALGYGRPAEERVTIGVGYTTRLYRRRPDDLPGASYAAVLPTPPRETRMGALFPVEGERWMVTLGGWLGDHAPGDEAGFLAFARSLPAPDIAEVIARAEPLDEPAMHTFPASLRRRYERLPRVPDGYLAIGDALCSFNPIYAQGMTVSALQATTLDRCLREQRDGLAGLPRRFYRRVATVIDVPWQIAAGADFAYPAVEGRKVPGTDALNWYVGWVQRAANRDPRVYRAFLEVTNLLKPPPSLFAPRVAWRVARAGLRPRRGSGAPTPVAGAGP